MFYFYSTVHEFPAGEIDGSSANCVIISSLKSFIQKKKKVSSFSSLPSYTPIRYCFAFQRGMVCLISAIIMTWRKFISFRGIHTFSENVLFIIWHLSYKLLRNRRDSPAVKKYIYIYNIYYFKLKYTFGSIFEIK